MSTTKNGREKESGGQASEKKQVTPLIRMKTQQGGSAWWLTEQSKREKRGWVPGFKMMARGRRH